jgi:SprT protein
MSREKVIERVKECVEHARNLYGWFPMPEIDFFARKTRYAGFAHYKRDSNGLSLKVEFNQEGVDRFLDYILNDTVPHEVAHVVCYAFPNLGSNHDRGWKQVCKALGGSSQRTHNLSLTGKKYPRPYIYTDSNGGRHEITTRMHNLMQEGRWYIWKDGARMDRTHFVRKD